MATDNSLNNGFILIFSKSFDGNNACSRSMIINCKISWVSRLSSRTIWRSCRRRRSWFLWHFTYSGRWWDRCGCFASDCRIKHLETHHDWSLDTWVLTRLKKKETIIILKLIDLLGFTSLHWKPLTLTYREVANDNLDGSKNKSSQLKIGKFIN